MIPADIRLSQDVSKFIHQRYVGRYWNENKRRL